MIPAISFLDFGEAPRDVGPGAGLAEVVAYAQTIEEEGFAGIWLGEHHGSDDLWGSPVYPLVSIAEQTNRIQVGTAGILALATHPLHVANAASYASVRFPGRVRIGIGKGLPTNPGSRALLVEPASSREELHARYIGRIHFLRKLLDGSDLGTDRPAVVPRTGKPAELWILGRSAEARELAGSIGAPFALARFFQGYAHAPGPCDAVAVGIVCAETDAEAMALARRVDDRTISTGIVGTPERCIDEIYRIAAEAEAHEVIVLDRSPRERRRANVRALASAYRSRPVVLAR
jgi:alkanesulfonate monooxygenase SsuD/methylene tetrahydromethanopterin reductase-like flavin-dependent oxidoreductase (luciferase family)